MMIGRTAMTALVAGCALSTAALAQQTVAPKTGITTANPAKEGARRVNVTSQILPDGRVIPVNHNHNRPLPRGPVVGYNNQDCAACVGGYNVAFVQPGSYDGSNPSGQASVFGLGDGAAGTNLRAPTNTGNPLPTDILFDSYIGDPAVWPGGMDADAAITEFSFITARQNTSAAVRTSTYRVLFFTNDGLTFKGGFNFGIDTDAGAFFYQQVILDLTALDPPLFVARDGLVMIDVVPQEGQTTAEGAGLAFAGGDLVNPNFPLPETLVAVGTTEAAFWVFFDGETGLGGAPAMVDPMFDGMEGVSYIDILNTGAGVNWGFTSTLPGGAIGTRTLSHDFPMRLTVGDGTPALGACVFLAGQFCFVTTPVDCDAQGGQYLGNGTECGDNAGACCVEGACSVVQPAICTALGGTYQGDFTDCGTTKCPIENPCPCDFNDSGALNSQDFFDFLSAFFSGLPTADFNGDLSINSQDFFDFLTCFFSPPAGCN